MYSVLYVDDEPALLDVAKYFLELSGIFSVTTMKSAEEALASPALSSFDAIVADYQMAGMDGIAFLKIVREKYGDLPFVIFTGRGREDVVIDALNSGADYYVQKGGDPVAQFTDLSHKIGLAIERHQTRSELRAAYEQLSASEEELREKFDELSAAENALRESEERYRTVFENTGTALSIIEEDSTISLVNSRFAELSGYTAAEIEGKKSWHEFAMPEDLPMMEEQHRLRRTDPKSAKSRYEFRFRTKSGEVREILLFVGIIPGTLRSVASFMDITDRRKAYKQLSESENKFAQLFKISPVALTLVSVADGTIADVNDAFVKSTGFTRSEVIGKTALAAGLVADPAGYPKRVADRLSDREEAGQEIACKRKSGEIRICRFFSRSILMNGSRYVLSTVEDVTERIQAQKALVESNRRFAQVAESAGEWIWEVDSKGRYTYASPVVEKILGYTPEEMIGTHFYDYFEPGARAALKKAVRAAFTEKKAVRHFSNPNVHKDGHIVMLETSGSPILAEDGTFLGYRGTDLDVTDRIRTEKALDESRERYRLMLMNAKDGILVNEFTKTGPGPFIEVNDTACRILGMTRDELQSISLTDLDTPETRDRAPGFMDELKKNRHAVFQIPYRPKNGGEKTLDISVSTFTLDGRATMFSIVRDITGQKALESALSTMVASMVGSTGLDALKKITEHVSAWLGADCVMIGEIQPDHASVNVLAMLLDHKEVTDFTYTLKGTPCENIREKGFCLYPDHVREFFPEAKDLADLNIRGYAGTVLRNSSGEVIGIFCVMSRRPLPPVPAMCEIMEVIAVKATAEIERSRIERELRESEERYRALVETSPDMIWEIDRAGNFRYISPMVTPLMGYFPEDVIGKPITTLVAEQGRELAARELHRHLTSREAVQSFTVPARDRDGHDMTVDIRASRVTDHHGRITGFRGVARDITDRIRAEEAIKRANRQLTLLGSATRHDALNKITAILGYLKLITLKCNDSEAKEVLTRAVATVVTLRSLMEFTRVYQDLGSQEPLWEDLDAIMPRSQVPSSVAFSCNVAGISVYADALLAKVFSNLADNSLRHGGKVTEIRVFSQKEGNNLAVVWEDNGIGIPAAEKELIFRRGYGKNTGLGLFLVREILDLTGITIHETGQPGSGVRFEILVPEGTYRIADRG
ncbi:hybrid sensor histidine kinase/response regulator [Methanoregula sp. UBA64]|uniref:hybrid sensor histidine kinase/response regulator n=1 Tax=Methanoregula sp. UBA64 TaxID=1915554 RepID=UPI0025D0CD66|nr:PAS domain S-box protein [Methanoregula sp. UBA64]